MPKSRHTEAQMVAVLQQLDAGRTAADVGREVGSKRSHDLRLEGEV
jgi:hypothetical protein